MLLSVIMSVYNGENFVEASIKSILNQSFKDFELIIVDDGSIDNTVKLISKYIPNDKRIRLLINKTNIGLPRSLNKAIFYSKGEIIARQDVDDISLKNRFADQIQFLLNNPEYAFCGTNGIWKQKRVELIMLFNYKEIYQNLIIKNCFIHSSIMIWKDIFMKFNPYDEKYVYTQDYELWCRLIYKYRLKAANLKKKLIILNKPINRFLKRNIKKFIIQKINCIKLKIKYFQFCEFKLKNILSLLIYIIEIITLSSLQELFFDKLKKINI